MDEDGTHLHQLYHPHMNALFTKHFYFLLDFTEANLQQTTSALLVPSSPLYHFFFLMY